MVYETGNRTVDDAVARVLDGEQLDRRDGLALLAQPVDELAAGADYVRSQFGDGTVDACSIVNAKAGNCAEDCGFCAQSVHFDTGIENYGFLDPEEILAATTMPKRWAPSRSARFAAARISSGSRKP